MGTGAPSRYINASTDMTSVTLEPENRAQLVAWLDDGDWVVACLCAAWCDTCRTYRAGFDELAARHPDKRFIWIDIEDEADVVGDIEVENFPTLLIQRSDKVTFFGTVLPELRLADRLIQAQTSDTAAPVDLQEDCDLRQRLSAAQD
jgi:thioredoxin 1